MRMWMVDPKLMCRKHLLGEHVELHMFIGTLVRGVSIRGYVEKNLFEPSSLDARHEELVQEMQARGYKHSSPLPPAPGPVDLEARIDRKAAAADLFDRCPDCRALKQGSCTSEKDVYIGGHGGWAASGRSEMNKMTELEAKVLAAFNTYDDAVATKSDLGVSWTGVKELAAEVGVAMATVKGALGSLVKKGLVYADQEKGKPQAVCLTEAGVDAFFELAVAESDADEPVVVAEAKPQEGAGEAIPSEAAAEEEAPETAYDHTDIFAVMYGQAGGHQPRMHCKALLTVAMHWEGPRKTYLEGAAAMGLKMNTAAAWWQVARKG